MGLFSTKKKTFADRFPAAKAAYAVLSPEQKAILDDFSDRERGHLKADKRRGLERITGTYLVPRLGGGLSAKELDRRTLQLYDASLATLRRARLTTNVSGALFADPVFLQSTEVKTIFTTKAKTWDYTKHRHAVEANAFGFKVDWSVPIQRAAEARPIYAGLNFTEHPYGAAAAYGAVALVLKGAMKDRCTYINTDTFDGSFSFKDGNDDAISASRDKICTSAQMDTLLANISDNQLKALCQVAESNYVLGEFPPNYIEAHVYGGIVWNRDLEEITIAKDKFEKEAAGVAAKADLKTLKANVVDFAQKYGVSAKIYNLGTVVEVLRP